MKKVSSVPTWPVTGPTWGSIVHVTAGPVLRGPIRRRYSEQPGRGPHSVLRGWVLGLVVDWHRPHAAPGCTAVTSARVAPTPLACTSWAKQASGVGTSDALLSLAGDGSARTLPPRREGSFGPPACLLQASCVGDRSSHTQQKPQARRRATSVPTTTPGSLPDIPPRSAPTPVKRGT
jgi:hypothetical protein